MTDPMTALGMGIAVVSLCFATVLISYGVVTGLLTIIGLWDPNTYYCHAMRQEDLTTLGFLTAVGVALWLATFVVMLLTLVGYVALFVQGLIV